MSKLQSNNPHDAQGQGKSGLRTMVLGAIGVIGPARLNYARVIPLVDYTARVLSQVMNA